MTHQLKKHHCIFYLDLYRHHSAVLCLHRLSRWSDKSRGGGGEGEAHAVSLHSNVKEKVAFVIKAKGYLKHHRRSSCSVIVFSGDLKSICKNTSRLDVVQLLKNTPQKCHLPQKGQIPAYCFVQIHFVIELEKRKIALEMASFF